MPVPVRISCALYSCLLVLYPSELRRRFGAEMTQVFGDQIWEAWHAGGTKRALRVWSTALWELIAVALPMKVCNSATAVTLLSMVSSLVLFWLLLWGIGARCHK
jgi:hypothetical protein